MKSSNALVGKTAVIVEDDGTTAMQIRKVLQLAQMNVVAEVTTGEMAVDVILRLRPDIVTMDINMPGGMDGIEVTRHITSIYPVCVIMITAYSDEKHVEEAISANASAYAIKPLTSEQLIPMMNDAYVRFLDNPASWTKVQRDNEKPDTGLVDEPDLILRLYMPDTRLFGTEMDHLISLFHNFLVQVIKIPVTLTSNRTQQGVSHNFRSKDSNISKNQISDAFKEFSDLLSACALDPSKAEDIMQNMQVPQMKARDIAARYSREGRRLLVDLDAARTSAIDQVEYEFKKLQRQVERNLKAELLDVQTADASNQLIQQVAEQSFPAISQLRQLSEWNGFQPPVAITIQNFQLNNPQIIQSAQGIIAHTISGMIYNEEDRKIIEYIDKYAGQTIEKVELMSALDELKDTSAPEEERKSCLSRLKTFLHKHSDKIEDFSAKVVAAYLEKLTLGG